MKKTIASLAVGLLFATLGVAQADYSKRVQKAFRGSILITQGGLPGVKGSDKETIAAFKKARLAEVAHTMGDEVPEWSFNFVAFMKKAPRVSKLSVDFYTDDKEKLYVANKDLTGIDPSIPILRGSLTISEDDGVNKGRRYIVKLTGTVKGREVTFATTKLTMK